MRVGKTNEKEIKSVSDFLNELSWLSDSINFTNLEDIDFTDFEILSKFDKTNAEEFIESLAKYAKNLFYERVLINCSVLLENCADPNLSYLDFSPDLKQLIEVDGFKDKNGKQFGDGDILQYSEHKSYLMQTGKLLVCWDKSSGCYGYKSEHQIVKEVITPFASHDELKTDVLNHCEIIGDVEKNPELLRLFS